MAAKRKSPNTPAKYLPSLLLGVGITLVIISTSHNILRLRSLSLDRSIVESHIASQQSGNEQTKDNLPSHIFIKWYVDVPLEPNIYHNGRWTVSEKVGSYLVASARPGKPGNIIIYGHNTREIMGNLRALKGGETITITMQDGTKRDYQVNSLHEVYPSETALLQPTTHEVLTLYTCSGFMDAKRFVVRAVPII